MPVWLVWLIVAGVLGVAETVTLTFVLVMFAGGALVAALTSALGGNDFAQVMVFIVASLALLALVRPIALRHLRHGSLPTGAARLVGMEAIALSDVDATEGRVRLNGAEWSARSIDQLPISPGTVVRVVGIAGATAVVQRIYPYPGGQT